jgi:hypothetical protein
VITGDHEAGKSYALMLLAIDTAMDGRSVEFICEDRPTAQIRFDDVRTRCERFGVVKKAYRSRGEQRIVLTNGAVIYFGIVSDRGRCAPVRLLDNIEDHPGFYVGAERVVRTELPA